MKIDFEKINKIYGKDILDGLRDNLDEVNKNIKYLYEIGIECIEEVFERYAPKFICDNKEFKNKVNKLVGKLGNEYVEILGENEDYWSELLW